MKKFQRQFIGNIAPCLKIMLVVILIGFTAFTLGLVISPLAPKVQYNFIFHPIVTILFLIECVTIKTLADLHWEKNK